MKNSAEAEFYFALTKQEGILGGILILIKSSSI